MDVAFLMVQNALLEKMDRKIILYFKQMLSTKALRDEIVRAWKSNGLSGQSIKPVAPSNNSLNPRIDYFKNFKF